MAVKEQDPHTGFATTGHEWNGIKELNTPVPKPVYFFLAVTFIFSVGYWVLMPAWPTGKEHTKGLLGYDDRAKVTESVQQATMDRTAWTAQVEKAEPAAILADAKLMTRVRQTGATLFGDNCAVCHGLDARGGKGYPDLLGATPLWGSDPAVLQETIRVGINGQHPETRTAQMLAFGKDGMIPLADVRNVVAYVQSLSAAPGTVPAEKAEAGKAVFAANCASCHGENGKGNVEMGAPDLTDKSWIYGGSAEAIFDTVWYGRQGHMPAWEGRISAVDRKILALYLADKRARP